MTHDFFTGIIAIVVQRGNPDQFLLIKNNQTGNITFVSGGREVGEDHPLETLKRELREETGLLQTEYEIIETEIVHEFVYNQQKKARAGQKAVQPLYLIETAKTNLLPEDEDVSIHGWFGAEEVKKELSFADAREYFENMCKQLEK